MRSAQSHQGAVLEIAYVQLVLTAYSNISNHYCPPVRGRGDARVKRARPEEQRRHGPTSEAVARFAGCGPKGIPSGRAQMVFPRAKLKWLAKTAVGVVGLSRLCMVRWHGEIVMDRLGMSTCRGRVKPCGQQMWNWQLMRQALRYLHLQVAMSSLSGQLSGRKSIHKAPGSNCQI